MANDLCFTLYVARFERVRDRACIGASSGIEKTKGGTRQGAKKTRRDRVKSIRQKSKTKNKSVRLSGRRGTFNEEGAKRETKERRKKERLNAGRRKRRRTEGGPKPTGFLSWAVFARKCLG